MNIKKIGNENTYVEFETVMNFGTKTQFDEMNIKLQIETIENTVTRERTMSFKVLPFEKTPKCFLLCKQVKKIVENGVEFYNGQNELTAEVLGKVVYNIENLEKAYKELIGEIPTLAEVEEEKK